MLFITPLVSSHDLISFKETSSLLLATLCATVKLLVFPTGCDHVIIMSLLLHQPDCCWLECVPVTSVNVSLDEVTTKPFSKLHSYSYCFSLLTAGVGIIG